jgi:hypothetical protein
MNFRSNETLRNDHYYLGSRPTVDTALIPLCHTCFSKENKVQTYMHARINFHAYSWHKWIAETISRKKKGDYQSLRLILETKAPNFTSSRLGGYVCLEPATSSQDIRVASSFWATLFIARVSTCRTQQVWGKNECKGFIVDWAISI